MAAAATVEYKPAGTYARTVAPTVGWLLDLPPALREQLDSDSRYDGRFDYRIDD
jgi:hypothetical protein